MRNLPRIASKVHREPWMILPERLHTIADLLEARLSVRAGGAPEDDVMPEEDDTESELITEPGSSVLIRVFGILGKHLSFLEIMCGGCSVDALCDSLEEADADANVERIFIWINSPGGTVTGIPEAGALIADIATRKEVTAIVDGECCSAAYWLASQCNSIVCTPSACIGSIGVYCLLLDRTRQLEMEGIKVNPISAGDYKLAGASFKPLSDSERKLFQESVDKIYGQFKAAVSEGRDGSVTDESMQGQVFDGEEAFTLGMVDDVVVNLSAWLKQRVDERNIRNEMA